MVGIRTLMLVSLALLASACGAGFAGGGETARPSIEVPNEIDDESYAEYARTFVRLRMDDPARAALRERIMTHLGRKTAPLVEEGDYDAVVAHFARMTSFFAPEDFSGERLPRELAPVARFVVEHGSPRGDEGRVLAARLVLATLDADGDHRAQYDALVTWGRDARATIPSAIERFSRLIDVWELHAALTPHPEVLTKLARLHVERRDAVLALLPGDGPRLEIPGGMSFSELRNAPLILRRAPLDVAGVFLAHGDIASAATHVEAMGDAGGTELSLVRVLRDARDGDDDAAVELAAAYSEGRPEVSRGLCEAGHRRSPADHRYPLCLARVAAAGGDFPMATGWYAEAIQIAPDERDIYDEALDNLGAFIARGIFATDPEDARGMARAAERILAERTRRFPDSEPAVTTEKLQYVVGLLEMNAGNPDEARRRFEASVAARETAEAHLELGRIAESASRPEDAARHFRRALDLTTGDGDLVTVERATLLEHLGDAFRESGDADQSARMYRQALELWDGVRGEAAERQLAEVEVRRGVLLDRLARRADAVVAFRRAMDAAPDSRDIYARILSHLVVSAPDVELASEVFVKAQRQLTLEPEWKVYFALWVETIARRAGTDSGDEPKAVLRTHASGDAWWGSLARFGMGTLAYRELLERAANVGERTEAHFYEGARLLGQGDREGAERQFRRVLETHMVNFYEYIMALELVSAATSH
jgi:tetratricopeptide (TPR) repeat protein